MNHLHRYIVIRETNDGILEHCEACKKRLVTKKDRRGRIDNKAYLKEHERDFMQPSNPRFEYEWGKPNYGNNKTEKTS